MAQTISKQKLQQQVQILEKELEALKGLYNLDESNQHYLEGILNNTNTPIFLKTRDLKYIFMNREFERLSQVTLTKVKGKDDFAVFPEPVAELFQSQDREVIKRKEVVEFEETIPLPDGIHTFITAKFPLFDSEGKINAVGGICTEITDRKKAEAELKEAEEKYRSIVDYSPLGIMQIDTRGIITTCNQKLAEILNTTVDRIVGFDLLKSLKDDLVRDATLKVLDGQIAHHEGLYTSLTSGQSAYLRGVFSPIFSTEGSVTSAIGIIEDITQRKETEDALHRAHDELENRVSERTEELNEKAKRLQETNIALEILLEKREADKRDFEEKVTQNIEELIRPYLEKLKLVQNEDSKQALLKIINANLDEITSTFKYDKNHLSKLTPAQMQIADLIKHGHTTKEIANLLNLSTATIACHRQEIRKRLSLTNQKVNLQSALTITSNN
jgi:PAS domain S-box-containing protein